MTDELLKNYEKELDFFRNQGKEFARKNPKIASQIGINATGGISDPHVERLIEAFAFLNARMRHKLDDDFPEIAQALLQVVYPHYLAPIPSMAVVKFEVDSSQAEPAFVKRHTQLETQPNSIDGNTCRFRTCYQVTLLPLRISRAELKRPPFQAPEIDRESGQKIDNKILSKTRSVLKISIQSIASEGGIGQWDIESVRFFINAQQHSGELYELILNNTLAVGLTSPQDSNKAVMLPRECLSPVGFEPDESMLPYTNRSFPGYGLLTEFFAFPEKFWFFDLFFDKTVHAWRDLPKSGRPNIARDSQRVRSLLGDSIDVVFYLDTAFPELETAISAESFELGCTPIVNLFSNVTADSQRLTQTQTEYRVVPDHRYKTSMEIYSIDRVRAVDPHGSDEVRETEFEPFYSFSHASSESSQRTFWHAVRRPAVPATDGVDHGTEMLLSLVDLEFVPSQRPDWMLDVETTCLNRDVPDPDPQKFGSPKLQCFTENAISSIAWLEGPTKTLRRSLEKGILWRLISHLNLNHLSLTSVGRDGVGESAQALREILALYDFDDKDDTQSIDGIESVTTKRTVGRVAGGLSGGVCRGVEVTIQFGEAESERKNLYLFASVLERFLAHYSSINSFSRLVAKTSKRELRKWEPRAGDKRLL